MSSRSKGQAAQSQFNKAYLTPKNHMKVQNIQTMHDTDLSFTCLENMKISVPLANSTQSRSGKPLKRRRIISDPTVLPPFKRANPKMLRHAISKANVTPMNDMEVQNIQAMNDTALPSSSRKHMKNSVPLKNSAQSRFSNAHQSGRPLQRMKLFIGDPTVRPPSKCSLQEMLLHATSKANVTPVTDMELLRNEAMKDVALQSSFCKHIKNSVQEILRQDLNYSAELFPNAEKYFN